MPKSEKHENSFWTRAGDGETEKLKKHTCRARKLKGLKNMFRDRAETGKLETRFAETEKHVWETEQTAKLKNTFGFKTSYFSFPRNS